MVVLLENRWPWFSWWLNHLPGPSISPKTDTWLGGFASPRAEARRLRRDGVTFAAAANAAAPWAAALALRTAAAVDGVPRSAAGEAKWPEGTPSNSTLQGWLFGLYKWLSFGC